MPWHKVPNHGECPESRPWAVVKDADGAVEGCHPSEGAADRQLAALYASEPDAELDELAADLAGVAMSKGWEHFPVRHSPKDGRFMPGDGGGGAGGGGDDGGGGGSSASPAEKEAASTFVEESHMSVHDQVDDYAAATGAEEHAPGAKKEVDRRLSKSDEPSTANDEENALADDYMENGHVSVDDQVADYAAAVGMDDSTKAIGDEVKRMLDAKGEVYSMTKVTFAKPNPGTPADRRLKKNKKRAPRVDYEVEETDVDMPDMTGPFQGWHGPLTLEGRETGDGREFAPESLEWSNPPLPLMWQQQSEPQHNRSVVVGRIDRLERRGAEILGWGVIDLGSEHGVEIARQMKNDMAGGVSVDVDSVKDADVEFIFPEGDGDSLAKEDDDIIMLFGPPPEKVVFHRGRIRGATLVALPAFVEAKLRLLTDDETADMLASLEALANGEAAADLPEPNPALVAAAAPLYPPMRWFQNPQHDGPTPWHVDQEGRVFGHLALWSSCHTTFADRCVTPPRESDFPYFMRREIETEEGELVGVGQITMGTGHAALGLGSRPAAAHYDNTGLAMVDCAVGTDKWGIWVAGALRPSVEGAKLRELRGASLSGDWRRIGGKLRLVAVLAVNVPGFPVPRTRARFQAEQASSLVAAGVVTEDRVSRYKVPRVEARSDGAVVLRRSRLTQEV